MEDQKTKKQKTKKITKKMTVDEQILLLDMKMREAEEEIKQIKIECEEDIQDLLKDIEEAKIYMVHLQESKNNNNEDELIEDVKPKVTKPKVTKPKVTKSKVIKVKLN
jgi:hypothetical protein